jgi:hypothetical protein
MKRIVFWMLLLCTCPFVFAQNLLVTQNTYNKVAISFTADSLQVEEVSLPQGVFSMVSMNGYARSNNPGAPQLPQLAKLLQVPVCDSIVVTVVNALYKEYDAAILGINHPLYPSQPSVSKTEQNPPFIYNQSIYSTNAFYALPLVSVEKSGIRRSVALANVYVSPVQYNPVTNRIRIYTKIDVEFTFVNTNMMMTQKLEKYASPMFELDAGMVINKMQNAAKNEYTGAPIKYLIIANSMFSSNTDLTAFVEWKRRLGYKVELAFTSDANVGTTTTSIKNFIQNKYDNATAADPAPTFLLLLGDVAQLPAFDSQFTSSSADNDHVTDLYYATLAGNDNIPDCYYGRLSATNSTQLSNQIAKIMMYEQYTMPDPTYLGNAVLIAGTDSYGHSSTHADGQVNYIYNNYINTSSTTHHFTNVYKHNYNCSSQAATIRSEINAGVSIANYTAHGSSSGWADPSFTTSHVSSMTNTGKYGLLIGNCCLSGKFDDSECFGESLLRAANKGAMGYIGASNSSYWDEDVYWAVGVRSSINANMSYDASKLGTYDKWFHTHGEAYTNWVSTIGGIIQGGNLSVQSSSSNIKQYYWEIYHCFGDPSVRVYMGIPNTMTVNADDITVGESQYTVTAVPYAYVALKKNTTEFVAAAFANASGVATLSLPGNLEAGTYELVVLAQNYVWYHQNVEAVETGSCISPSNFTVSNVTPFTANLSWTGVSGVYNIQLKAGNGNWTSVATGVTTTTYTLSGLQDDTDYQVRIQSVCGSETSSWRTQSFTTPVACPVPTSFVCTDFTAHTASLSWTENGSAISWTLQYGTNSTFASGTYTEVTLSGNPSTTLTGLTTGTNYYARVRANCGSIYGNSQWSNSCTFTPSNQVTVCEDFEAYTGTAYNVAGVLPVGWNVIFTGTSSAYSPHVATGIYNSAVISSGNGLCFTSGSSNYGTDNYAILPTYDGTFESITFDYRYESTSRGTLYFGYITDITNANTFVSLQTVPASATQGTNVSYSLVESNIPDGARLAFKWNHTSSYYTCGIDNVCVTTDLSANACMAPQSLVVEPSTTSAVVSWTGEANSYNVRYRTAGTLETYFFDDFENGIDQWTVIRNGEGTTNTDWHTFDGNFNNPIEAHSGTYMLIGRSWNSEAYNVDNWLITPAVTLNGTLKFWVRDDGSYHEHYDVYVSTGGNAISDFTLLYSPGNASSTWTEVTVDLSAYHGVTGYIALRLTDEDQDYLLVDDFGIYSNGSLAGEWQTLVTSTSTATITGLLSETEYEVEVQADCGVDGVSAWTNPVHFTTNCPSYNTSIDEVICEGESYNFFGQNLTTAGEYTHTLQTVFGCDSIITLQLAVNHPVHTAVTEEACESFVWNGVTYTKSGDYTYSHADANGCTQVDTLHLTINNPVHTATTEVACESFVWNGTTYTESGDYTYSHADANGCTQVDTLHLTINNPVHTAVTEEACESFEWNGVTYTKSGDYTYSHQDDNGCTQVDTLHLTINNPVHTATTEVACESFVWNGVTYTESGDYTYSHQDGNGCTQVDTLHLTINNPVHTATTEVACESFIWNESEYSVSGDYTYSHQDANGCTQVDTLHLTINNPVHTAVTEEACESFIWNGSEYSVSGDYTYSHQDANGCTQVDTLHLTINNPVHTATTEEACESFVWNGVTYTESGDYTYSHQDGNGCTQVDTLHLTINNPVHTAVTEEVCESFVWNGVTYTKSGDYTYSHLDAHDCTQVDTLHLTINNPVHTAETEVACESFVWNGTIYTESGDYTYSHLDDNGCTQVDTLHLTINNPVHTAVTEEACESFVWNGTTYTESGDYTYSHADANGCTQVDTLHLTINNPVHTAVTEEACESFVWNGVTYTESGDYTYSHLDDNGCTQVDTLHLTINNPVHTAVTEEACESFEWNGVTYTESGDYTYSHQDANGCTQVDTLHLTINNPVHTATTEVAYDTYTWVNGNGETYNVSGTYYYSHPDVNGCIQVDTLYLTVYYSSTNDFAAVACEAYEWDDSVYTMTGDYTRVYQDVHGADSVVTMHLRINYGTHNVMTETVCNSYEWLGETYSESGTYTYAYENADGCASVDTLHLTVNYSNTGDTTAVACDSFDWYEYTNLTQSGDYLHTFTNAAGCDSVVTLHLTVNPTYAVSDAQTICASELPYTWNNVQFTEAGTQTATLQTVNGCDSVVTMTLTVNPIYAVSDVQTICASELPYTWNNVVFTEAGTQTATLQTVNGCDSVVTMTLMVNPIYAMSDARTICASELPYTWNNVEFTEAGIQTATLQTVNGCDSVVTMTLTVNLIYAVSDARTICASELPYTWNNVEFIEAGTQTATLQTVNGCDSVVTMTLTVNNPVHTATTEVACESFVWNGVTYTESGDYTYSHQDANGCTQVDTLHLTIINPQHAAITEEACESFVWNGVTYTESGDYTYSHQDANGCTQVDTLHLTINNPVHTATVEVACESFIWNESEYSVSGEYIYSHEDANGCTQVDTLHLTINNPVHTATTEEACESFVWNGVTYTESGDYTFSHADANGCTQVDTLHLTINNPVHTAVTEEACESFEWNGVTYTESGDYTYSHQDANGCTQVDTLHLTINNPVHTAVAEEACESFVWNGTTYTESGDYTYSHADANGCTQVDTLHLTINNPVHTAVAEEACESFVWNGVTYTESGDYTYSHLDGNGCTQVDTLHLTINNPVHTAVTEEACESFVWNGTTYTESGDYTYSHEDANGCTQVDTLHLTINNSVSIDAYLTINESDLPFTYGDTTFLPGSVQSGDYSFYFTTAEGCDSIIVLHLTIEPVGISNYVMKASIKVYPNPTTGILNVEFVSLDESLENVDIQLFDMYGKLLNVTNIGHVDAMNRAHIDLSQYANGVYFIKAVSGQHLVGVRKVVKQ